MKKILFVLLFITSSLFAQDEIKRHPMWKDAGGGIMTPKAQYNLNPFGNQLGNVGAAGTRFNFGYFDTTDANHLSSTTLSGGVMSGTSLALTDGTDTYKTLVSSDKWTLQNDAGSPETLLQIDSTGIAKFYDPGYSGYLEISNTSGTPHAKFRVHTGTASGGFHFQNSSGVATWGFGTNEVFGAGFEIFEGNINRLYIVPGGDVLIGTNTDAGDYKLQVNGNGYFNGVGTFVGTVNVGVATAVDTQSPDLVITGDADSDGTAFTTEALTLSLTSNATPTLATWGFTSTQGAGYTFDKAVTVAGAITGSGNFALTDPGTSANSYSISLKADNATTVQEGLIQVMYGANPYMRFSPPNAAGVATAFIDLKSNQMIFPDSTSLTTNTGANDVMLFKAVDNDDGLLYTIAALTGGITPTFDLLAGRLTGTLSGNSQNITGVGQLAATTYGSDGSVSNAELLFINTLSSNAQTQIDTKAPSTSPTFATSITGSYLTASEMLITDGSKNIVSAPVATYPSLTELTYVKGVTSAIQTQLNLKAPLASPTFTGTVTIPTPFTLGAISVTATGTELNYVAGVTSSIQTQLNSKAPTANPTFTGTMKRSVTATITASTTQTQGQGALTTDVNEVSVVANVNDVVTLPSAVAGMEIFIINNGANTLQIFPASGDNLGAGLNASTTLASGSNVTFASYNDTNWEIK